MITSIKGNVFKHGEIFLPEWEFSNKGNKRLFSDYVQSINNLFMFITFFIGVNITSISLLLVDL